MKGDLSSDRAPTTASVNPRQPLGAEQVSVGLHRQDGDPTTALDHLWSDARLAAECGFDGVTLSEHHAGAAGYYPCPTTLCAGLLESTQRIWVAPCPTILPLRHTALLVEEIAWLAARHPGRIGLGVAPGSHEQDFKTAELDRDEGARRFAEQLEDLAAAVRGTTEFVASDPAIQQLASAPQPFTVVCATTGRQGVRRAARLGFGIMLAARVGADDAATLAADYRSAGGHGAVIATRWIWIGDDPPIEGLARQARRASDPTVDAAKLSHTELGLLTGDAATVIDHLNDLLRGPVNSLSVRFAYPGVALDESQRMMTRFATEVLPYLRIRAGASTTERFAGR